MNRTIKFLTLTLCFCALTNAVAQDFTLAPASSDNFRFKDIMGQTFSSTYISTYSYANANVVVSLDTTSNNYLSGTVSATGLKPNFAYQIKLAGRPSGMATTPTELAAADDATNERLGRIGRWWRQSPNPSNSNDADYDTNKDVDGFVYQGYLIIGFFVTDAQGTINTSFTGNSSYHVVWRTDQRGASINDGPPLLVTLPATTDNAAYDVSLASRSATLYGEWEPTRAFPGQLQMPIAEYHATLMLTEESFHDVTPLSGNWTTAMSVELGVVVPTVAMVGPGGSITLPLQIDGVSATFNKVRRTTDVATLSGTLNVDASLDLRGLETQCIVLGVTRNIALGRTGNPSIKATQAQGKTTDGTVQFKRDRKKSNLVSFKLMIRKATLVLPATTTVGKTTTAKVEAGVKLGGNSYYGTSTVQCRESKNSFTLKK